MTSDNPRASENLELRRQALEATGWKFIERNLLGEPHVQARNPEGDTCGLSDKLDFSYTLSVCPAVESDPGISEAWFLEWCEKNGWLWQMERAVIGDGYVLRLAPMAYNMNNPVTVDGATPSEARARAVIAAAKKGQP